MKAFYERYASMNEAARIKNDLTRLRLQIAAQRTRLKQITSEQIEEDLTLYDGSIVIDDQDNIFFAHGACEYNGALRIPYDGEQLMREQAYVVLYDKDHPFDARCICSPRSIAACVAAFTYDDLKGIITPDDGSTRYAVKHVSVFMKKKRRERSGSTFAK